MLAPAPSSRAADHTHDVPHDHAHGEHHHGHDHHGHDHHGHAHHHHGHKHAHTHAAPRKPRLQPVRSLIALSGGQRLVLVLPLIGGLWLATFWAMS